MAFAGFPDDTGRFFTELSRHQTREWFLANKDRYERDWVEPFEQLLAEVAAGVDEAYPHCELAEPKVFRIYRDVRFAKDKTPYKTNIAGMIAIKGQGGVMDKPVALYLQLGSEVFAAAGHYQMPADKLAKVRRAMVDEIKGKELLAITRALAKKGFTFDVGETLAKVPKGFDPAHPLADFLRKKGVVARFPPLPPIGDAALARWLRKQSVAVAELVTWTTYAGA
jgi:uncharacterized protein (TIGR02453 family)